METETKYFTCALYLCDFKYYSTSSYCGSKMPPIVGWKSDTTVTHFRQGKYSGPQVRISTQR